MEEKQVLKNLQVCATGECRDCSLREMRSPGCIQELLRAVAGHVERLQNERADAVADLERLLWLSGLCRYCAKGKGKGHRNLDRPCQSCEPKWKGPKRRKPWND